MATTNNIILGSGYVYIAEYSDTIPEDATLETSANQFGFTKGGATLSYSTDFTEINDDNGQIKEVFLETDSCEFKLGAFMSDPNEIVKICPTASVSTSGNVKTVKIGGVGNDDNKKYVVRFVHKNKPLRITIIGKNTEGFELEFSADDALTLEPTFTCSAMDDKGVLAEIRYGEATE